MSPSYYKKQSSRSLYITIFILLDDTVGNSDYTGLKDKIAEKYVGKHDYGSGGSLFFSLYSISNQSTKYPIS